jgi:hypothetical protein
MSPAAEDGDGKMESSAPAMPPQPPTVSAEEASGCVAEMEANGGSLVPF